MSDLSRDRMPTGRLLPGARRAFPIGLQAADGSHEPTAMFFWFLILVACHYNFVLADNSSVWINYPNDGLATMTHYDLPRDWITACGCTASSTHYPTAALSQMAYGSSNAYGGQILAMQYTLWEIYVTTSKQVLHADGALISHC
jgi:hypothetical protein